jgi:hypothetical protein
VDYQIARTCIAKDLKNAQKRVCPTYPIHVGIYTLLDFGHARVEARDLEEINMCSIDFKMHDPIKVVGNHCIQIAIKKYFHEDSTYDDIFKNVTSYDQVLERIQTLSKQEHSKFYKFQNHRKSCFQGILQQMNSRETFGDITKEHNLTHNGNPVEDLSQGSNPKLLSQINPTNDASEEEQDKALNERSFAEQWAIFTEMFQ